MYLRSSEFNFYQCIREELYSWILTPVSLHSATPGSSSTRRHGDVGKRLLIHHEISYKTVVQWSNLMDLR